MLMANDENLYQNGAKLQNLSPSNIKIINSTWKIQIDQDKDNWSLWLNTNKTWGFHSIYPSVFTLTLYGYTSTINNCDIIISIADSNNAIYFTWTINLDGKYVNKIAPACYNTNNPESTDTLMTGNVYSIMSEQPPNEIRICRPAYIDNTSYCEYSGIGNSSGYNGWPLTFSITNYPVDGYSIATFEGNQYTATSCGFGQAIPTEMGINAYITASSVGQIYYISHIDMEYSILTASPTTSNPTTASPTTNKPTSVSPTTSNPTTSKSPTTASPTTNIPTSLPTTGTPTTLSPSTINPSISPTNNPITLSPTKAPTSYHYIACNDDDECTSTKQACRDNIDCIIDCIGDNACQQMNISCPINGHCQLNCGSNIDDCKELQIDAKQSKSLTISCGNGPESCDRMRVYCPVNSRGCECNIYGLNGYNVDSIIHLYAVQGLNDINITDDDGKEGSMVKSIQIFCREDYSSNCFISESNKFDSCMSGDKICTSYTATATTQINNIGDTSTAALDVDNEDFFVMIILVLILVVIVLICCTIPCLQCAGIKCDGFHIVYIISLRVIDVITDIILSYIIVEYGKNKNFNSNILIFIAFGSVICIIIPYTINLVAIHWAYNLPTDTASIRPKEWFKKYIIPFIMFYLITNDTYLLIELFSSGLFGSDIFDSGHTIIEKKQTKLFKTQSIITGNVPQIIIQIIFGCMIYSEQILEPTVIILLILSITSSLFVIITFIRLMMKHRKLSKNKYNLIAYRVMIKLLSSPNNKYSKKQQLEQIKRYRGSKRILREEFVSILGIKKHELQIGHIELDEDGCFINLVQRVPKTTNDYQFIENMYKNKRFAEIIEDIFHLEWDVAVKLILNQTTEINKQITLEEIELALEYEKRHKNMKGGHNKNNQSNDCLSDEELNDIADTLQNGHNHHGESMYAMPSTSKVVSTPNGIEIDNKSQNEYEYKNQFDNESVSIPHDNNKRYYLQVIPSKSSNKTSHTPPSISTMKGRSPIISPNIDKIDYADDHYRYLMRMHKHFQVKSPSTISNTFTEEKKEEESSSDDDDDDDDYVEEEEEEKEEEEEEEEEYEMEEEEVLFEDEYYDESRNDDDDDDDDIDTASMYTDSTVTVTTNATSHASGDCSQYSPYIGHQKGRGRGHGGKGGKVKYLHPFNPHNQQYNHPKFNPFTNPWIKDVNKDYNDYDIPSLPSEHNGNNTVIIKGSDKGYIKRTRVLPTNFD